MNKALLDTDMFSEIARARNTTILAHAKTDLRSFGRYTLSTTSVMEVIRGFQRNHNASRLNAFLATLPHLDLVSFDWSEAELAGRIAGDLERAGRPIGLADTMIAATALANHLELVTGNTTDFQQVQQVGYPLVLVNWRD